MAMRRLRVVAGVDDVSIHDMRRAVVETRAYQIFMCLGCLRR